MFGDNYRLRLISEIRNLFPLFRYLVLQTETHAFCLALASAALLGFFPASVALLTLLKHVLRWDAAYNVLLDTLRIYFPTNQAFIIRNIEVFVSTFGRTRMQLVSLVWVLMGSAGVFIPLETGFNRLWRVRTRFIRVLPLLRLSNTQGPLSITVSFLLLVCFETFVVLGGAFLASQAERYPWMGFLKSRTGVKVTPRDGLVAATVSVSASGL